MAAEQFIVSFFSKKFQLKYFIKQYRVTLFPVIDIILTLKCFPAHETSLSLLPDQVKMLSQ